MEPQTPPLIPPALPTGSAFRTIRPAVSAFRITIPDLRRITRRRKIRSHSRIDKRPDSMWGKCVYRGPGRRRTLALTFDDGPSEGSLRLIEYLAAEGIRATFFQC